MKVLMGLVVSTGLALTASTADAQILAPYFGMSPYTSTITDIEAPYAAIPQEVPAPRYASPLLPPQEVYAILRENGFSPIGALRQRGLIYTIAVADRSGEEGRLMIDARNGRILRFMPAYVMGRESNEGPRVIYGAVGPMQPLRPVRSGPRPPASIPHVASRTVPKTPPPHAGEVRPLAAIPALPAPAQQSAAVQAKPGETQAVPQAAAPSVTEAKPAAPQIRPTQDMPKMQGLD
jgi:hypothetical protein